MMITKAAFHQVVLRITRFATTMAILIVRQRDLFSYWHGKNDNVAKLVGTFRDSEGGIMWRRERRKTGRKKKVGRKGCRATHEGEVTHSRYRDIDWVDGNGCGVGRGSVDFDLIRLANV
nr:hypothetical protein CFP56_52771 [Quercus suber]